MKTTTSSSPWSPHLTVSAFTFALLAAVGGLGLFANAARAQEYQLDVGVRSTIADKPFGKSKLQDAKEHGKIYGILSVKQVKSEEKLVKPVDEGAIMQLLSYELNTHGYRLVAPGQDPEIVLTVFYGRGYLTNPFMSDSGHETPGLATSSVSVSSDSSNGGAGALTGTPSVSITGTGEQLFREKGTGFEQRLQKAQYEKLYIRVAAWQYPTTAKAKAKQLWNATMLVDDPDHRDLNMVAAKMLEAGVAYFDKEIKDEEVDVYKPLPNGRVNVGTPEVVEPKSK